MNKLNCIVELSTAKKEKKKKKFCTNMPNLGRNIAVDNSSSSSPKCLKTKPTQVGQLSICTDLKLLLGQTRHSFPEYALVILPTAGRRRMRQLRTNDRHTWQRLVAFHQSANMPQQCTCVVLDHTRTGHVKYHTTSRVVKSKHQAPFHRRTCRRRQEKRKRGVLL